MLKRRLIFKLHAKTIKIVIELKYLDLILDSKFKWFPHLRQLQQKIAHFNSNTFKIRIIIWNIHRDLLKGGMQR